MEPADNPAQTNPAPAKDLARERSLSLRDHFPFAEVRENQNHTLDRLAKWNQSQKKFFLLEGPTGFGKCFALNTPILMFDGTIKKVQDVQVDDLLMGDDSTPRKVFSLSQGFDQMFDVVPIKGKGYRVNSRHILSLRFTKGIGTKGTYANNQKSQVPQYRKLGIRVAPGAAVDIPLEDYLGLSKTQKHILKGYRVGVEFPVQPVSIDPYFLGLWLGDGDSDRPAVTTSDPEIGRFLHSYASTLGLLVNSQFHNNTCTMDLNTGERGGYPSTRKKNLLLDELRRLGVLRNKHIPQSYKCNSREIRLKLLAGIIDSDGHQIIRGGYEFTFVVRRLAEDLTFLCRSLGLAAYMEPCEKTCTNSKNGPMTGQYYRVLMSGFGIEKIPSMLTRKRGHPRKQKKNPLVTGIKVVQAVLGEFFGFSVDGNGRFLLGDFTVVHNSPVDICEASYAKVMPTFGQYMPGAYILTPQKTLAEQYMKDFEPMGLVELKGRGNYPCGKWTQATGEQVDCETGAMLNDSTGMDDHCDYCPYRAAKDRFIAAPFGATNFDYYLNETSHAHQLPDRNLLILDEGHNAEDKILGLTDTKIDKKRCEECGVGRLPVFDEGDNNAVLAWLDGTYIPAAMAHANALAKKFREARDDERVKYARRIKAAERFLQRINMFRNSNDPGEWFAWSDWQVNRRTGKATGTGDLLIKPLTARLFADDLLFSKAQKVLVTSATILDFGTFMRNLGISPRDAETLAVDSEFPVANRPIFYRPVGNMRYRDIDETLPKMAVAVEGLLRRYATKKGIIHSASYKVNRYIVQYLQVQGLGDRIITHDSSKGSRELAVERHHADMGSPTVLVSPSMYEGLDLYDDLSRFQILTKVMFPALDPYTRARMGRDPEWYNWVTSLKMIQATGRSIRSKTDKADTWILDSGFADFIQRNNRQMPKWWLDSIIW